MNNVDDFSTEHIRALGENEPALIRRIYELESQNKQIKSADQERLIICDKLRDRIKELEEIRYAQIVTIEKRDQEVIGLANRILELEAELAKWKGGASGMGKLLQSGVVIPNDEYARLEGDNTHLRSCLKEIAGLTSYGVPVQSTWILVHEIAMKFVEEK